MDTRTVTRKVKLGGIVAVPLTSALLAFAAVAFACVPQASISTNPKAGATGTNVAVTGSSFTPGSPVQIFWGGISGQRIATTTAKDDRTISVSFVVPANAPNGQTIVAANQVDGNGVAIGSPANTLFNVTTPGGTVPVPVANVQDEARSTDGAAALAPAPAPAPAAQPAATATPTPAPRVRPAPARTTTAARTPARAVAPTAAAAPATPAPESAPAPAVEATPAPAADPAPAVAPAPESAPATSPARRSVMVSMSSGDNGSPALAIALVGVGLVLALGASAVVLAGRRERKAPAKAPR